VECGSPLPLFPNRLAKFLQLLRELENTFGTGYRGKSWDIVDDVPNNMRIVDQLSK
jgi:hypothetical protein